MTGIRSSRIFFVNGLIALISLLLLVEAVTWSFGGEAKLNSVHDHGGALSYVSSLVLNTLVPESMTVFILAILLSGTRYWSKIRLVDATWRSLIYYQLKFLPTLLIAFVIFIPFTQSIRYLLMEFPTYSFNKFWHKYILDSYSLTLYFAYLFPVLFIGYGALTISLATGALGSHSVRIQS